VGGTWKLPQGELTLKQDFQMVSGTLKNGATSETITNGRIRGDQISFDAGATHYTGKIAGNTMEGTVTGGGAWKATR
jgi:hypothetical protein